MKYFFSIIAITLSVSAARAMEFPPCYDAAGERVSVVEGSSRVPSPAYSTMMRGQPTIVFNDEFLDDVPNSRSVLGYIYLHECGHHALGHVLDPATSVQEQKQRELEADCFAAKEIKKLNQDNDRYININTVLREVLSWPTDPEHPSGQVRARVIAACYQRAN